MGKILSGELVRARDFEVFERVEEDGEPMDVDDPIIKPEPGLMED